MIEVQPGAVVVFGDPGVFRDELVRIDDRDRPPLAVRAPRILVSVIGEVVRRDRRV